ncbi:hypothetical protein ASG90_07625 [Nocardioides sp. Soil797]|nr:hypothetical protein ASG90_07625 [Nocardioides sp. Soil797]
MRLTIEAVLRAAVLVAAPVLFLAWLERGMGDSADADIGGGAMALLLVKVIAGAWFLFDASRRDVRPLTVLWVVALCLMAVASAARNAVQGDPVSDLVFTIPLVAVMAGLPALAGGAIGAGIRRGRRAHAG